MLKNLILIIVLTVSMQVFAQKEIKLYNGAIPNSRQANIVENNHSESGKTVRISGVTVPTITAYFPKEEDNTGKAIVIFPGGGYSMLAINHEGHDIAEKLTSVGISAFVVKYRLPSVEVMEDKSIGPLQDAQRAVQYVREHAQELGILENQIGIIGSSAGGHLASSLGVHYQDVKIPNPKNTSLRPDFMLLLYPVITMKTEATHAGSRKKLLGEQPSDEQVHYFSNETQVDENTPPTFLVHAKDDKTVPFVNAEMFRDSLLKHDVAVQLFTYEEGGHGFGLTNKTSSDQWFDHFIQWIKNLKN